MQALVWTGPRQMVMRAEPDPTPESHEVLIKVAYAGICGSELSSYLGHNALRVPPVIMGHEFSGKIVELGSAATAYNASLAVGQAVTVNPLDYTEPCEYCEQGLHHLSPTRQLVGAHRPGAYASHVSVPAKLITPLPETMSLRIGALTEPTACGVRIGEIAGDVSSQDCLIIGAGPIGLLALQVLQLNGAKRIFIVDLDQERLAMGAALGGETLDPNALDVVEQVHKATNGRGVSVAVDAVGTAGTRTQCISATRARGIMVLTGLHEETSAMPAADIIRREINVRGSFAYSPANFAQALTLLDQKKIRLDPWIEDAPLADGDLWFNRLMDAPGNVSKVLLVP